MTKLPLKTSNKGVKVVTLLGILLVMRDNIVNMENSCYLSLVCHLPTCPFIISYYSYIEIESSATYFSIFIMEDTWHTCRAHLDKEGHEHPGNQI